MRVDIPDPWLPALFGLAQTWDCTPQEAAVRALTLTADANGFPRPTLPGAVFLPPVRLVDVVERVLADRQ